MSAQHTGGPWNASRAKMPDNTGGYDWCITDGSGKIIGEAFEHVDYGQRGSYDIRPAEANARLIAAAPDLLAALEALVGSFEKHRPKEYWDAARAAIAKAKGAA
jgi:hypothetical protein